MTQEYSAPLPAQPYRGRSRGVALGILSLVLFLTGPLATSLGFVSYQQARRSGGSGTLGVIGFCLGTLVSIAMAIYIFIEVANIWDYLA